MELQQDVYTSLTEHWSTAEMELTVANSTVEACLIKMQVKSGLIFLYV